MKNIFLSTMVLLSITRICFASEAKLLEKDVMEMMEVIRSDSDRSFHQKQVARLRTEVKDIKVGEVGGIFSPGSFLRICNSDLELSFGYGEPKEMDRLIAIYFLLTKEPFTPENFEPSSQIYIKAKGKVKTNISRSGDLEGVFFLTKLLEYSSDRDRINKCRKSNR